MKMMPHQDGVLPKELNLLQIQAWQDLNPQPSLLESDALPIELHAYAKADRTVPPTIRLFRLSMHLMFVAPRTVLH